jgi:hypothetical protein
MEHIMDRAIVKIPSDLICIIESIRDTCADMSRIKRPGAEEDRNTWKKKNIMKWEGGNIGQRERLTVVVKM